MHLEQWLGKSAEHLAKVFLPEDERDADSVLALAGDISSNREQLLEFLIGVQHRFKRVIFVAGNHCPYGSDIDEWNGTMTARFQADLTNVQHALGDVGSAIVDGDRYIFTTLWADGGKSLYERAQVGRCLRDFLVIKKNGRRFTVPDMCELHRKMKAGLIAELHKPWNEGRTVVITHHLPSYKLCHPRFGTDCNGGFASDCDDILSADYAPVLWIAGHTHDRIVTKLGRTQIVVNPSGYYFETDRRYHDYRPTFVDLDTLLEDRSPVGEF